MIPERSEDLPPLSACIEGRVYRLRSRNLSLGVFDGHTGFIGIRQKFGSRYLATEHHWDYGEPFGTVSAAEDTGISVPDGISLTCTIGTVDRATNRRIVFKEIGAGFRSTGPRKRAWVRVDTGEVVENARPVSLANIELFVFLDGFDG